MTHVWFQCSYILLWCSSVITYQFAGFTLLASLLDWTHTLLVAVLVLCSIQSCQESDMHMWKHWELNSCTPISKGGTWATKSSPGPIVLWGASFICIIFILSTQFQTKFSFLLFYLLCFISTLTLNPYVNDSNYIDFMKPSQISQKEFISKSFLAFLYVVNSLSRSKIVDNIADLDLFSFLYLIFSTTLLLKRLLSKAGMT